jgi:T4 RnlA family RNA ligase
MFHIDDLQKMIDEKYIEVHTHPTAPLSIYNYSPKAQYDRLWNEVTLTCRGLILNDKFEVVARPFAKFFNLGEVADLQIPAESFDVYEKMDGSLGILYWLDGQPFIASRGSFTSDQSQKATEILYSKYVHTFEKLNKNATYLFEIIYPSNRIVVNYSETEDLVLLAVVDMETGIDLPLEEIGFTVVKKYDGLNDIHQLKSFEEANREGFVIKYQSGLRLKVKFDEYLRIHKIVTMVSTTTIWECLLLKEPFDEILDKVPDEFYDWVKKTIASLQSQFDVIEEVCNKEFKILETRKETAVYIMSCSYPAVLFAMLDNKDYASFIWKILKPEFQKPHST